MAQSVSTRGPMGENPGKTHESYGENGAYFTWFSGPRGIYQTPQAKELSASAVLGWAWGHGAGAVGAFCVG